MLHGLDPGSVRPDPRGSSGHRRQDGTAFPRPQFGPAGVSAWASANTLTLGQVKTAEKSNEITAIPQLLQMLELQGCIVTIDAMGCQQEIAQGILDRGAGSATKNLNKDHGRIERRECWTISDPACLEYLSTGQDWPGLCSVVKVVGRRETPAGTTVQPRYYISSLEAPADHQGEPIVSIRGIADFTRISMTAKIYSTIGLDIHGSAFLIPSGGWFAVWRERTNAHSADSHFGHQRCNHRG